MKIRKKEDKSSSAFSLSNCEDDLELNLLFYCFAKNSFESKECSDFFSLLYYIVPETQSSIAK